MCDSFQSSNFSEDVCNAFDAFYWSSKVYILTGLCLVGVEFIIVSMALFKLLKRGQFKTLPLKVKIIFIVLILYTLC